MQFVSAKIKTISQTPLDGDRHRATQTSIRGSMMEFNTFIQTCEEHNPSLTLPLPRRVRLSGLRQFTSAHVVRPYGDVS